MIERTFIHLPGVGPRKEREFWRRGIRTWQDFLERGATVLPGKIYDALAPWVERSLRERRNAAYFSALLTPGDRWRLYPSFPQKRFLDIETCPTPLGADEVTVVGIYDSVRYMAFVQGRNIEEFQDVLEDADIVVTFNGARFDIPFLEDRFPGFRMRAAHIDLLPVCRRLLIRGGLKQVEKRFGVERPPAVAHLDGYGAVRLWQAFQEGDDSALETLLQYNREDAVNLEVVMEKTVGMLCAELEVSS